MDTHEIVGVTHFEHVGPFRLRLEFDDGGVQTIDFSPVLFGELFGPLRDPTVFNQVAIDPDFHTLVWPNGADFDPNQVAIDPDFHTLVWPNGADFDPADLRHWPEVLPAFLEA